MHNPVRSLEGNRKSLIGAACPSKAQIVNAVASIVVELSEPCPRFRCPQRICDSTCNRMELIVGLHGVRAPYSWDGALTPWSSGCIAGRI